MNGWGVFNDEGLLEEAGTEAEARAAMAERYTVEDEVHVAELCTEHEQEAEFCDGCLSPACETCLDGSVLSDTCDECGERHCETCDPCDDEG